MEDLNAASLEDVKTWFTNYYGAANVVLVLAGDIDADTALKKVEHFFGDIPAGPPVARYKTWVPQIAGTRREVVADRVPLARLYKVWNIPPYGEADNVYLDLASDVLASAAVPPACTSGSFMTSNWPQTSLPMSYERNQRAIHDHGHCPAGSRSGQNRANGG